MTGTAKLASCFKVARDSELHTSDTVLLSNLRSTLRGLGVATIPESDVGTSLCESVGDLQTNTSARTGDNGRLSLK